MSEPTAVSHPTYHLLPPDIEGVDFLAELALDMHWSRNHATDELWEHDDDPAWDATEAEALYALLEDQMISESYARNGPTRPPSDYTARVTPHCRGRRDSARRSTNPVAAMMPPAELWKGLKYDN